MEFEGIKTNVWTFDAKEDDPVHVIARGVEADVHAQGWDGQPRLGFVLKHPIGDADGDTKHSAFAVCEIPMFDEFYYDPSEGLATWNRSLLRDMTSVEHLISILEPVKDDFCGWVFISETWFVEGDNEKPQLNAKHPNRKESRVCVICLEDGRIVQVSRIRNTEGGLDKIDVLDNQDENVTPAGFVIWNLSTLVGLSKQFLGLAKGNAAGLF